MTTEAKCLFSGNARKHTVAGVPSWISTVST